MRRIGAAAKSPSSAMMEKERGRGEWHLLNRSYLYEM